MKKIPILLSLTLFLFLLPMAFATTINATNYTAPLTNLTLKIHTPIFADSIVNTSSLITVDGLRVLEASKNKLNFAINNATNPDAKYNQSNLPRINYTTQYVAWTIVATTNFSNITVEVETENCDARNFTYTPAVGSASVFETPTCSASYINSFLIPLASTGNGTISWVYTYTNTAAEPSITLFISAFVAIGTLSAILAIVMISVFVLKLVKGKDVKWRNMIIGLTAILTMDVILLVGIMILRQMLNI